MAIARVVIKPAMVVTLIMVFTVVLSAKEMKIVLPRKGIHRGAMALTGRAEGVNSESAYLMGVRNIPQPILSKINPTHKTHDKMDMTALGIVI